MIGQKNESHASLNLSSVSEMNGCFLESLTANRV